VSLFLYTLSNFKNGLLSNEIIVIRNNREAHEVIEERHEGGKDQQGRSSQVGGPKHTKFESNS
jgi:hypothetical protein